MSECEHDSGQPAKSARESWSDHLTAMREVTVAKMDEDLRWRQGMSAQHSEDIAKRHDEAMRMQALAIGARVASHPAAGFEGYCPEWEMDAEHVAKWAYEHATGREW